ncbi:chromosome segregation atpase [Verticillium dahliae]
MPLMDRDHSWEGEGHLRHQHSASSDHGRALIPIMTWSKLIRQRWDSSDPERAPPPLPLNPQSPSISPRKGTSSAIQSAHATLAERARESSGMPSPLTKRTNDSSPDKSLVRGPQHRRMQSLHTGTVRDISLLLENGPQPAPSSPTKPAEKNLRPSTPSRAPHSFSESVLSDKENHAIVTSPTPGPSLTPIVRPTARRTHQSILGDNTPPQSATMLALQHVPSPAPAPKEAESPLQNANPAPTSTALVRAPLNFDGLSNQILSLTNIATALQRDMAQLSRRSRDNATDLSSLKEATTARDEDIRKSIREMITNLNEVNSRPLSRDPYGSGLYLDNKPHYGSVSKPARPFSLPRIPSPTTFSASLDRDSVSTPSLCSQDASSSVAILEKVMRDMGTKEGQDLLLSRLSEVADRLAGVAPAAKVEELLNLAKKSSQHAIVRGQDNISPNRNPNYADKRSVNLEGGFDDNSPGPVAHRMAALARDDNRHNSSALTVKASEPLSDDFVKVIRGVKDSIAQSGGLTAEVKALVRELRGEVLGMGREIGRRLDEVKDTGSATDEAASKEEIAKIVDEGLDQMKEQISELVREHRRSSTASATSRANTIDYQEIYNAMRAALRDAKAAGPETPDLSREDVVEAVRLAWEDYKPQVEAEELSFGREDVLEYLKEGLQDYVAQDDRNPGATRDEVFQAVVEGLKHFVPPRMDSATALSRVEILDAVRECLEEFEFPVAPSAMNAELSRDDMVHAVQEGLRGFDFPQPTSLLAPPRDDNDISSRLQQLMDYLRQEFSAVSEEAKQNVAANGRDTEQVLDATKDGLERLRNDMEELMSHINLERGTSVEQEELMETLAEALDGLRDEMASLVQKATEDSRLMMESHMDSLRDTVHSSMVPVSPQNNNAEVLEAVKIGLDSVRAEMHRPFAGHAEILDALHEGLADLRSSIDKVGDRPVDLTANDEILDALKAGLDGVRSDIDALRQHTQEDKAVTSMNDNAVVPAAPADALRHDDIKNLEVLITQLRIKVEAMNVETFAKPPRETSAGEDFSRLEDMLRGVQESVSGIAQAREAPAKPASTDSASREDVEAIETILRNTKAKLDDLMDGEQAIRKEHLDSVEALVVDTREAVSNAAARIEGLPSKDDMLTLEALVAQIANGLEETKEQATKGLADPERVTKSDVDAVGAACLDIKTVFEQMIKTDMAALASGEDIQTISTTLEDLKTRVESSGALHTAALEERQAEIVGVGERVSDVKTLLEEFQTLAKGKLEDGATGIEALGKLLEGVSETVELNAGVGQELKELSDIMKAEFEESRAGVVGAKLDTDEKFSEITEKLGTKIDEKIAELMLKYDEFQTSSDERAKAGEARDAETDAALLSTKNVAEELKTLVDTLGSAVTDSLEKMEEASRTVFSKVEELANKTEENDSNDKTEHQQTRDQITQAIASVGALQGQVGDFQPQILQAVKDVLVIVDQHYEHSKSSATDLHSRLEVAKAEPGPPLLPPIEKYDDTVVHEKLDRLVSSTEKYDDTAVHEKLDKLVESTEKYDDAVMQEKLDRLVNHTEEADKAFSQLQTLEQVHQQVMATAAEISSFLANQAKEVAEANDAKEKSLQETTLALERQLVHKEQVDKNLASLRQEEDLLKDSIKSLRMEQDAMNKQKTRLTADVSSLEMALRIRREELHEMENRAEGLERRILEGVMDHSRVLLMSKAAKGQEMMNRKRVKVPKTSSRAPAETTQQPRASPAVNLALSAKRNLAPPGVNSPGRRILSLSQINNNVQSGGVARSQSVRTPAAAGRSLRKSSWGGGFDKDRGAQNKENISVREVDEDSDLPSFDTPSDSRRSVGQSAAGDDASETETLRRTSQGTTIFTESVTDSMVGEDDNSTRLDYSDDDLQSQWTESAVGTDLDAGAAGGNEVMLYEDGLGA